MHRAVASSSGNPTDFRLRDCHSGSHQPQKLRSRCRRDTTRYRDRALPGRSEVVLGPESQESDVERLNLIVVLSTPAKDVLGKASYVRDVELYQLRLAALEIVGQQVSELQARKRVGVDGSVAAVDTGSADALLEPASIRLIEKVALPPDQELNLHESHCKNSRAIR